MDQNNLDDNKPFERFNLSKDSRQASQQGDGGRFNMLNDMSRFNPFKEESVFHPFRWFILIVVFLGGLLMYSDRRGMRLFSNSGQEQWNPSGQRGYHK
ncbi:hypothetical protein [Chitinophaga agri]|uniref:Uncharacterized protein n=1 Tax=Chitinophaga agri TaxID=2703787 RepID=A0A6B9ZKR4_9BACT|nr:hypothetical protein [Chitinophaga agri]QHS62399.1 hypothetical protein GWR21_23265 [Chitinophaga agri]